VPLKNGMWCDGEAGNGRASEMESKDADLNKKSVTNIDETSVAGY
jgi:hypothetical protein